MRLAIGKLTIEITWRDKPKEKCLEYLRAGLFIHAIKTYRAMTGASLKDAKEYCEQLRANDPQSVIAQNRVAQY